MHEWCTNLINCPISTPYSPLRAILVSHAKFSLNKITDIYNVTQIQRQTNSWRDTLSNIPCITGLRDKIKHTIIHIIILLPLKCNNSHPTRSVILTICNGNLRCAKKCYCLLCPLRHHKVNIKWTTVLLVPLLCYHYMFTHDATVN